MTPRKAAGIVAAALLAILPTSAPAFAAPDGSDVEGADLLSVSVDDGKLRLGFRERGGKSETDPRVLRFTARTQPVGQIPHDPAFRFLGRPGTPVWTLWQGGYGFPSIDTTGVAAGDVTLELVSVDGPGSFAAYTLSAWGRPDLLLDSDGPARARLAAGRRTGGLIWAFDAAGEYRVRLRATAGGLSDEAAYAVTVPAAKAPAGTAAKAAAPAGRKVISDGHVDMGPMLSGGRLTIKLKDDATTPPIWRELTDVVLKVTDKARIDVPSGAGYDFLGKAGDKVYLLPQTQQPGIVWPGWNTQHESVVGGTRGNVTWRLKGVDGPGGFKLFRTGSFGTPEVIFDSGKKLPQQLAIAPNSHAHGNWAFTKAGDYRLTVEMTATTTGGRSVSDTRVLTLAVGDGTGTAPSTDQDKDKDKDKAGGNLARTGVNVVAIAGGGALLLVTGIAAVLTTRRRRGDLPNENENH